MSNNAIELYIIIDPDKVRLIEVIDGVHMVLCIKQSGEAAL